jgi:hypothetical protein
MDPSQFLLGQNDSREGMCAAPMAEWNNEDPMGVQRTCYNSISLGHPKRQSIVRTYKVVVPLPSSENREQLHINQRYPTRYVKQRHTRLVRDVFSFEYGCKPSQWASLVDRYQSSGL